MSAHAKPECIVNSKWFFIDVHKNDNGNIWNENENEIGKYHACVLRMCVPTFPVNLNPERHSMWFL